MTTGSPTESILLSARNRHDTSSRADRLSPALLALAALLTSSLMVLDAPTSIRLPIVLAFLAMAPGFSIINLFSIDDITQKLVLSLGLSIALDTIVAVLFLYAGLWSPSGIILVLIGITLAGAGVQLRFTPATLGFLTPAGPEISPDTAQLKADTFVTGNIATPVTETDVNGQSASSPIADTPSDPTQAATTDIKRDVPPGRLARAMVFLGFVGGCIMLISRTSRRSS